MSKSMLEQGRAAYAYAQVEEYLQGRIEDQQKEYRAYLKKIPAMIQTNGLGQTMAFYFSKRGTHRDIYQQIAHWVEKKNDSMFQGEDFLEVLVNMDSSEYRMIAVEVVALTNWMRRFADGLIK
mgnify:CR=1 FL=1